MWVYWYFFQQSWFHFVLHPAQCFAWCTVYLSEVSRVTIYTALKYSFPNLEPVHCSMSGSNCCFLTCIQVCQEAGKVVWYSHFLNSFPHFVVIHTVKGFSVVSEAEVDVFLELSYLFDDPVDIGNLISAYLTRDQIPLPFLNPACTSGSSWFMYYWSLAWRILSMTMLACEMSAVVW